MSPPPLCPFLRPWKRTRKSKWRELTIGVAGSGGSCNQAQLLADKYRLVGRSSVLIIKATYSPSLSLGWPGIRDFSTRPPSGNCSLQTQSIRWRSSTWSNHSLSSSFVIFSTGLSRKCPDIDSVSWSCYHLWLAWPLIERWRQTATSY